jgi:hypothetical protein
MRTRQRLTSRRPRVTLVRSGAWVTLAALVLFLSFSCPSVSAQTAPSSERLSPDTVFYMQWRGFASLTGANKKNHALQLWNDPDFAPVRVALMLAIQQQSAKDAAAGKSTNPAADDILSLLDNGSIFGVAVGPAGAKVTASNSDASNSGIFLVYDATGKTALIQKLKKASQANEKEPPIVRNYDFGGTSIEVRTSAKDTSYSAQVANYYIFASQKEIMEGLITRFRAPEKPASSVTQTAEYKLVRPYLGSDSVLEFFGRVPDLNALIPPEQKDKPLGQFAAKFQLGKIHVLGGSLSFNGEATRMRGALLGDASPGGLFDLAGASSTTFQTQTVVDGGPIFTISRIDLAAFYHSLRSAISAALPPQQAGSIAMGEGMAQNYLGMPIEDALGLFTGEIASSTEFGADDGSPQRTFAITIQKQQDVLRVLRALGASMIVSEDTSGTTTFLDFSYPFQDPVTGKQRRSFYYIAVTPHMLFAAQRKVTLREAMQRENAKPGAVSADPEFARMRGMLPEKLSGLGGADFARVPWDKVIAYYGQQMAASQQAKGSAVPPIDWSKLIKSDVFSRHLRLSVSGWWKDANGVYFDSYLQ